MGQDIGVSGGAGGMSAQLADLDRAGGVLARSGTDVGEVAASVLAVATDPEVVAAAAFIVAHDPGEWLSAGERVGGIETRALSAGGPGGAAGEAAGLVALAAALAGTVTAYRAADAAAAQALRTTQDLAMEAAVTLAPVLVAAAALDVAVEGPTGAFHRLDRVLFEHPWLVDTAAGGLDVLVTRLGPADPACAIVLGAAAAAAGVPWPPRTEEEAARVLAAVASLGGGLEEDGVWRGVEVPGGVTPPDRPPGAVAPAGVAGLVTDAVDLEDGTDPERVRVSQLIQPDGSSVWVLQLPGTQDWDPRPGDNPFDLTTNVAAMTGEATLAAAGAATALDRAMAAAGRSGSGDRVMLVGHSQGGILAASLASSARFRAAHHVTDVVTMGAPIGRFPIPAGVTVLSLEHSQDPVPRLDAVPNPDRASWTTVTRDLAAPGGAASAGPRGAAGGGGATSSRAGGGAGAAPDGAVAAHAASRYQQTASQVDDLVAAGGSRSLNAWARHAAPFVDGRGRAVVTDYHVRRRP